MADRIITTDGGDIEIDRPTSLVLSAGDLTRIMEWAAVAGVTSIDERTPDSMLLRQIDSWLFPDVWLVGRPCESPRILSIAEGLDG